MTDTKIKVKAFRQPAFVICATLLLLACIGKATKLQDLIDRLTKIPIDLRKSLDDIDSDKLLPYVVSLRDEIGNKDTLNSLGTKHYIQWELVDSDEPMSSPVRYCNLFITYYGKPDRVPHVPEECYLAAGNTQEERKVVSLNIDGLSEPLDVRMLVFKQDEAQVQAGAMFSLNYFFKVNQNYACSRSGVRKVLAANLTGDHSFFSKVEWKFYGKEFRSMTMPSDEQNVAASEKLISKLLPILENEHWPILDSIEDDEKIETEIIEDQKKQ